MVETLKMKVTLEDGTELVIEKDSKLAKSLGAAADSALESAQAAHVTSGYAKFREMMATVYATLTEEEKLGLTTKTIVFSFSARGIRNPGIHQSRMVQIRLRAPRDNGEEKS